MTRKTKVAAAAALSAALLLAGGSPASAAGYNWSYQLRMAPGGCFAWTTWSQYMVQPHIYQQPQDYPDDRCSLVVTHNGYDANGNMLYHNWVHVQTNGDSTETDGPAWYYGPWNGNGHMCVYITVYDLYGDSSPDFAYC